MAGAAQRDAPDDFGCGITSRNARLASPTLSYQGTVERKIGVSAIRTS